MNWLVGLPNFESADLGQVAGSEGRTIAYLFLGVLTIQMVRSVLPFVNKMRLDDLMHLL